MAARIRTIKPDFFRHEKLYLAEHESGLPLRVAFAGLWTVADREGRFKWRPRDLKLDCLPYDELNFEDVLNALQATGFVTKYEVNGEQYGLIPSWLKHQCINVRESKSTIPSHEDESASICMHVHARGEGKGREGKGSGREGFMSDAKPSDVVKPKRREYPEDFENFISTYPKNGASKPEAFKSYLKALKEADHETIKRGAEAYSRHVERGGALVAHATTWLNQSRWTVDYDNLADGNHSRAGGGHKPRQFSTAEVADAVVAQHNSNGNREGGEIS